MAKKTYRTPEVFIEEISKYTPSIRQPESAIPVFIGATEKACDAAGNSLFNIPVRVSSAMEFEFLFGNPAPQNAAFDIVLSDISADNQSGKIEITCDHLQISSHFLAYQLAMFLNNGGKSCYIISTGTFGTPLSHATAEAALNSIVAIKDITLLTICDCPVMEDVLSINNLILQHCANQKNRFAILDIWGNDNAEFDAIRTGKADVTTAITSFRNLQTDNDNLAFGAAYFPWLKTTLYPYIDESTCAINSLKGNSAYGGKTLEELKNISEGLYLNIRNAIWQYRMVLPPSAAMAGVYATTDKSFGVWKAPANVTIKSVTAPTVAISDTIQGFMNVDETAGKSVNAFRVFNAGGLKVWGARTLAGNDNEWRYISVRRFYLLVKKSISRSIEFVVFEPNDANTWNMLQRLIEDYLIQLWRSGALAGSKPAEAFFIAVGLNKSMTQLDIAEGRLIIEVGIAPVRPAEFIIMKIVINMQ